MKRRLIQTTFLLLASINFLFGQSAPDFMRSTGKIYVVVAGILVIFIGIIIFLISIDKKITQLEKQIKDNE